MGGILLAFEVQMKFGSDNFFTVGSTTDKVLDSLAVSSLNISVVYTFRIRVRTSVGYSRYSIGIDSTTLTCSSCSPAHGRCILNFPNATCQCDSGFYGDACDQSTLTRNFDPADYGVNVVTLRQEIDYKMYWKVVGDTIEVALRAKVLGWLGWGLSPNAEISKQTIGCVPIWPSVSSDQYIFWVDDTTNQVFGADFYNHDFIVLCLDTEINGTKNILGLNGYQENGYTTIKFTRLLKTGEEHDLDINLSQAFLAWAIGEKDPVDETLVDQHKADGNYRGYVTVDLTGQTRIQGVTEKAHIGLGGFFVVVFMLDIIARLLDPWVPAKRSKPLFRIRHVLACCWIVGLVWVLATGYWARASTTRFPPHVFLGWLAAFAAAATAFAVLYFESGRKRESVPMARQSQVIQGVLFIISGSLAVAAVGTALSVTGSFTGVGLTVGCVAIVLVFVVVTLIIRKR